jgi:hypothetical protein
MNDVPETPPTAPLADIRARNKGLIFAALAEAGIGKVTVEYDGSGDSGQIGDVFAWRGRDTVPLPSCKLQLAQSHPDHPFAETGLAEAVENLAWDCLEERHAGWENDDGGFGTFVFDVAARTLTLEHNERFTDFTSSTDEF